MPALVHEMGVGRDGVDFHAQFLEFFVMISQIAQFGRTDERKVGWIEEYDRPFSFEVCIGNLDELAVVISLCLERDDFGIDQR